MRVLLGMCVGAAVGAAAVLGMPDLGGTDDLAVITGVSFDGKARVAVPDGEVAAKNFAVVESARAASRRDEPAAGPARSTGVSEVASGDVARWADTRVARLGDAVGSSAPAAVLVPEQVSRGVVNAIEVRDPSQGRDLVRDLQRELKRVGCYYGTVDGDWGPGSRRGMRAFISQLNSQLPTDQPDFIMLTLVRGHAGVACNGTDKGSGVMTARRPDAAATIAAVPAPVRVYRIKPRQDRAIAAVNEASGPTVSPAPVRPEFEGRMAVGGPTGAISVPAPVPAARPVVRRPVVQRAASPRREVRTPRRRNTQWTATFFERN